MKYPFEKVVIIGLGLIGGSIAKAIKKRAIAVEVLAVSRNEEALSGALSSGIIDGANTNLLKGIEGAELIILALPILSINKYAEEIIPAIKDSKVILTDVGSTKSMIVNTIEKLYGSESVKFVGSHPMAGSEKSGFLASRDDLFEGSTTIITRTERTDLNAIKKIEDLWTQIGSKCEIMSPEEHDQIVAAISHLPHITAYSLVNAVASMPFKNNPFYFAAGGFKDSTRIASSSALLWNEIILSNRDKILESLNYFKKEIDVFTKFIENADATGIAEEISKANRIRSGLK